MKFFPAIVLVLFLLAGIARAQSSADAQYINIYGLIQQADSLSGNGQLKSALADYQQAQQQLQQFQKVYPDWGADIVNYRLGDLAAKISALQAQLPKNSPAPATAAAPAVDANSAPASSSLSSTPTSPASAAVDVSALQAQLQTAQDEIATLQARLKEALGTQPSTADTATLAADQEQIRALMKENDLLKSVENSSDNHQPESRQVADLKREVAGLRARVAADEAAPVPYTAEELALMQPGTNSPPASAPAALPADMSDLAASAQQHFANHDFAAAEADYQKILKRYPDNDYALGNLAVIELQDNQLAAAEKHIQSALARNPNDAFNLGTLGKIKFAQGKYDDALTALSRAAQLDPNNPEVENFLGAVYGQKGLRQQGEAALRKAIELDPNYALAHDNLAVMYLNENPPLPQLARWHYEKALAAGQPRNPDLEKSLADKGAPVSVAQ